VIKVRAHPRRRVMALLAGLREAGLHMVRSSCALEILQVTAHASRIRAGQVVIAIHVTLRALHAAVCSRQREAGCRMIERGACPGGGAVALLTGLRKSGLYVIWVRRALEVLQVAADTGCVRAGQIVIAIHVALRALHTAVSARQGEPRGRVIEVRPRPGGGVVALLAGLRKTRLHMVRLRRALEIL